MSRCLVTGAAGFIGSHIVEHLVMAGHEVCGIDDLSGGSWRNVHPRLSFYPHTINNISAVEELFSRHKPEYVYHAAAYAAENLSHFIRRFNYENNLIGSINLINASIRHKVKCFVFLSSVAVYGHLDPPMSESDTPRPSDPYGIAKWAVERDLEASYEMFGMPYIVFRCHNVYGERQRISDPYRNVVGIFMKNLMEGKPLPIFGDGHQTRAFTYVGDIAPIIARAPELEAARNQVFNLGSDEVHDVAFVAQVVQSEMGKEGIVELLPERNEVHDAWCSHDKANAVFPACTTPLGVGIGKMTNWALGSEHEKSKPFENIEITEGLPESWRKLSIQF